MKRRLYLLACVLLAAFLFAGCGGDKVVAVVNGENITADEVNTRLEQIAAMYGYDLESQESKERIGQLEQQVMEYLIEEKVILQSAREKNISVSDDAIAVEMKKIKEQLQDEDKYQEFLEARKFTEDNLKSFIANQLMLDQLIDEVTREITTSDRDPKAYYEEFKSEFYQPEKIKARNIVVSSEEEAKAIITRLDQGEDFTKLAVELSIDPTAKDNEGLIDYFDSTAMLVEEFKEAAFALKVGEYTKTPVQTLYGYHIIKAEDKIAAKTLSFEEVKDELLNRFIMEDRNEKFIEFVDGLMDKADIERKLPTETPPAGDSEADAAPEDANQEDGQAENAAPDEQK